jgi:hypothetical protein
MAASVGAGGADDSLKDVSLTTAIARSSQSPQGATGGLHRTTYLDSRFEERIIFGQYSPHEEGRASSRGGIVSLLGEAINSVRDVIYIIWNSSREGK